MLEPEQMVEVPGDGGFVEGAVGERSGDPVAAVAPGSRPDPELAERRRVGGSLASTSCGCCGRPTRRPLPGRSGRCCGGGLVHVAPDGVAQAAQRRRALKGLEPRKRGPRGPTADQVELAGLRRRLERAETDLKTARRVIEVQGNVSALCGPRTLKEDRV
jgi:hypothetical protein